MNPDHIPEIPRLGLKVILEKSGDRNDIGDEQRKDGDLNGGCLLNILLVLHITDFARAILDLVLVEDCIDQAAAANAES